MKKHRQIKSGNRCLHCGYYNRESHYCNDLDCKVDPDFPICSDKNYYA